MLLGEGSAVFLVVPGTVRGRRRVLGQRLDHAEVIGGVLGGGGYEFVALQEGFKDGDRLSEFHPRT